MKKQTSNLFITISKSELNALTNEVKETIAVDRDYRHRSFNTTGLWNIQRQKRKVVVKKYAPL